MAKPRKPATPSKKTSRVDNQAPAREKIRVKVGEPWHVEVAKIRVKAQVRLGTLLVAVLAMLLTGGAVMAWIKGDREQTNFILQFTSHGLSIAIGWVFGKISRNGG